MSKFCIDPPKKKSYEIWLELARQSQREMLFKANLIVDAAQVFFLSRPAPAPAPHAPNPPPPPHHHTHTHTPYFSSNGRVVQRSRTVWTVLERTLQETFLSIVVEIDPSVMEEMLFKDYYYYIWRPFWVADRNGTSNISRGFPNTPLKLVENGTAVTEMLFKAILIIDAFFFFFFSSNFISGDYVIRRSNTEQFWRGQYKDHFREVELKLAQLVQRRCRLKFLSIFDGHYVWRTGTVSLKQQYNSVWLKCGLKLCFFLSFFFFFFFLFSFPSIFRPGSHFVHLSGTVS